MRNKHFFLVLIFFLVTPFQFTIGMDQKNSSDKPYTYTLIKKENGYPRGHRLAISENNILAIASDKEFELFDTKTKTPILQKSLHNHCFKAMAFNHNGTQFALIKHPSTSNWSIDVNSTIEIYDIKTENVIFFKELPASDISSVAFHPMDDNFLLSYQYSRSESKWCNTFSIHPISNPEIAFITELDSPFQGEEGIWAHQMDLPRLICHPKKNSLSLMINNIWHNINNSFLINEKIFLINTLLKINHCLPAELNRYILNLITTLSLAHSTPEKNLRHWKNNTTSTEYSPNGDRIAKITGHFRNYDLVSINNSTTREETVIHKLPYSIRRAIALHPNNEVFATIDEKTFQYRNIDNGKEISLPLPYFLNDDRYDTQCSQDVVFSKDGKHLYIACDSRVIELSVPENVIRAKCTEPINKNELVKLATHNVPLSSHFMSNNTILMGTAALGLSGIIALYFWNNSHKS